MPLGPTPAQQELRGHENALVNLRQLSNPVYNLCMALRLDQGLTAGLHDLCRRYGVRSLRLFGSAARSDFDPAQSDLDFLVEFDEPPNGMRLGIQFFGFLDELQKLFGREVDLLEEHAIENSRLKRSAEASAVTIYAA